MSATHTGRLEGASTARGRTRQLVTLGLKLAVSAGLVWLIFSKVEFGDLKGRLLAPDATMIALAGAIMVAQILIVTGRFQLILATIGHRVRYVAALAINLIGVFFNQSLPSTVGGDAVRIWRLVRTGLPLGRAVNGVILDRATALIAILLLIVVVLPTFLPQVTDTTPVYAMLAIAGAGLIGAAIVLSVGRLPGALQRFRAFAALQGLIADFRHLVLRPGVAVPVFGLAVLNHVLTSAVVYALAVAYEVPISLWLCIVLVPPVLLVAVVPISIAGWGVREGAMITAFGLAGIGAPDALIVSVSFGLVNIIMGLPGGLVFLLTNAKNKRDQD